MMAVYYGNLYFKAFHNILNKTYLGGYCVHLFGYLIISFKTVYWYILKQN